MTELTQHVEWVVQPVRARPARKRRMRQELLGHLTAAYEEERARLGDDRLALNQALGRFGDPAELTRELQAAVPRLERVAYARVPGSAWADRQRAVFLGATGESALRHAVRLAAMGAAVVFALLVLLPLVKVAGGAAWSAARVPWDVVAAMTAHAFVSMLFVYGYCRALAVRSRVASLLGAAAFGAAAVAWGAAFVPVMTVLKPDDPLWAGLQRSPGRLALAAAGGWAFLTALAVVSRYVDAREKRASGDALPAAE
jgi:hypothetical protein